MEAEAVLAQRHRLERPADINTIITIALGKSRYHVRPKIDADGDAPQ